MNAPRLAAVEYERRQDFNAVTRRLHGFRARELCRVVAGLPTARDPVRILELGCGTARTLAALSDLGQVVYYHGVDIEPDRITAAEARAKGLPGQVTFSVQAVAPNMRLPFSPDVVAALELLEHLPEDEVSPLLAWLASLNAQRYVFSVPIEVGPAILIKNVGSAVMRYARHREYLWRETLWASVYRLDKLPPHGTGHRGFDWRWLRALIRRHFDLIEARKSPVGWIPACFAPSILFVCRLSDRSS